MNNYFVMPIKPEETHPWLLKKHYAKRVPQIIYAFGLYFGKELQGCCTFGYPPNYEYNDGKCIFGDSFKILTLELNRLCVNDGLPKNSLSFFVSHCLSQLPKPSCIVSYSDPNHNHHGYIYQATNWIYTGTSTPKHRYEFESGEIFDVRRGIHNKGKVTGKTKLFPTHRYLFFNGNKRDKRKMKSNLKMKIYPYPKGNNVRYDASEKVLTNDLLFNFSK